MLPILAILGGLAAATGIGAGAYGLGTSIKDRNAKRKALQKAEEQAKKNAQKFKQQGKSSLGGLDNLASPQGNAWSGYAPQELRFQRFTPEQQSGMSQVLKQSLGELGKNKFDFAPIEAQARQGFSQNTIPSIAERFSKLGAQKSSAFGQQLGEAGAGLERDLGALKANYGLQQQQSLHNLLGLGLTPQYASTFFPGQQGFKGNIAEKGMEYLLNPETLKTLGQSGIDIKNWIQQKMAARQNPNDLSDIQSHISGNIPSLGTNYMPQINFTNPSNLMGIPLNNNLLTQPGVSLTNLGNNPMTTNPMGGTFGNSNLNLGAGLQSLMGGR